ncbi:MAG: hypothetical protein K1W08_08150 [Lachnospiraceae bacterium]|jgi:cytochrome c biogenesis factor
MKKMIKKNLRQLIAAAALIAIALLLIAFVISAFTAGPGEAGNRFMALLFGIIAIPLLAWILLFCVGRMQQKHTIAEFFPEQESTDTDHNKKSGQKL